jgi:hypothetical protein
MLLTKLRHGYIWRRILYERLSEPLHLNLLAVPVALFGGFRRRVEFDLVLRCQHAYSILKAADEARELGLKEVTLVEFGVAAGAGLMNICQVAARVERETGVRFRIFGFDTGRGMPAPTSYRDHPELYQQGDFPMRPDALRAQLPRNCQLVLGEIHDTLPAFVAQLTPEAPIGFVSIDVDYYSSTKVALGALQGPPDVYLPRTLVYLDDLEDGSHNSYCGELLAIREFNDEQPLRKIEKHPFLRSYRLFRNARWIDHVFTLHVLDHPVRNTLARNRERVVIENPYLAVPDGL